VLDAAAEVARRTGAEVHLIRVLLVPPDIPPGAHTVPDHLEEKLVEAAEAELRSLTAKVPDVAFSAPLIVVDGNPWRRIVEAAKTLDVDLIVVGNHVHHGLDRVFESLAGKVIEHTDRNVLVVRVRDPGRRRSP
jgi:universal stress protein F